MTRIGWDAAAVTPSYRHRRDRLKLTDFLLLIYLADIAVVDSL